MTFCISFFILIACFLSNFGRNIIGWTAKEYKIYEEYLPIICDNRFLDVRNIFDKRLYTIDNEDKLAWKFIDMVPKDASVTTTGDLLLALSSRKEIYELGLHHPNAIFKELPLIEDFGYNVDYILINKKCVIHGLGGRYAFFKKEDLDKEIEKLIKLYNFLVLEAEGNFILLKKIP